MDRDEKPYRQGIAYGLWAGWLFGFAGLQRLYLGKYGTGFLWLLTWGLAGFGQIYDLITLRRQVGQANLLAEALALREQRGNARSPEQQLLSAAERQGGYLTVTQAVQATGLSFRRAEELLRGMVASGYVDVDNAPDSGVVVYRFPELGTRLAREAREARGARLDARS